MDGCRWNEDEGPTTAILSTNREKVYRCRHLIDMFCVFNWSSKSIGN